MSPESIELWLGRFTSIAAWSGAIAAGSGVLALVFSNWDSANKAASLARFKEESQERTAKLENETAVAKLELAKLKTPRSLTLEQHGKLVSFLREFLRLEGSIRLAYIANDSETTQFATEVRAALDEGGCRTSLLGLMGEIDIADGITLIEDDEMLEVLSAAFSSAGIPFRVGPLVSKAPIEPSQRWALQVGKKDFSE